MSVFSPTAQFLIGQYKNHTTTTTYSNIVMQTGFEYLQTGAGGQTNLSGTVTFPTAYTTLLGVIPNVTGAKNSATPPTGITDNTASFSAGDVLGSADSVTNSTFLLHIRLISGTFGANQSWNASWIAWGIL